MMIPPKTDPITRLPFEEEYSTNEVAIRWCKITKCEISRFKVIKILTQHKVPIEERIETQTKTKGRSVRYTFNDSTATPVPQTTYKHETKRYYVKHADLYEYESNAGYYDEYLSSTYIETIKELESKNKALEEELKTLQTPASYLDDNHEHFAPELALCINLWERLFIHKEGNQREGVTTRVKNLLEKEYISTGNKDGSLSGALTLRISSVVNPKDHNIEKKP